jgi:type IV pilus assembly protein PilA
MISKIKSRLASDEGFTLIELLVVIVILGILLAIAVPSYLGFKARAEKSAAKANVRAAQAAVEAFYSDHGTYLVAAPNAMTQARLKISYDAGLKLSADPTTPAGGTTYCITSTVGGSTAHFTGPGGGASGITLTSTC